MWETEYTDETRSFFADNGELVADLFQSIESLRFTEGLPDIGAIEAEPGYYYWLTEGYIVAYRRIEARKVCRIISIKPDTY